MLHEADMHIRPHINATPLAAVSMLLPNASSLARAEIADGAAAPDCLLLELHWNTRNLRDM